jgi:hypothetical protein
LSNFFRWFWTPSVRFFNLWFSDRKHARKPYFIVVFDGRSAEIGVCVCEPLMLLVIFDQ